MKISISIPTYNRLENVKLLSKSLSNVHGIQRHNIRIYDDASIKFTKEELKKIFPNAEIKVKKNNVGADINTYQMCKDFLTTEDDVLLICDSDLIVHTDALKFIENNIDQTEGVLSLFNSSGHKEMKKDARTDKFVFKKYVGAAGVVFSKKIVQELIENIPYDNVNMWDWAFCNYFHKQGIKIFVSKQSYVLHTGIDGENSNLLLFEFAKEYVPSNDFDKIQIDKLNRLFVESYIKMSDFTKVKIILRKFFRVNLRKAIGFLFGDALLFKVLSWRKKKRYGR
ncbi:MAG: hypothetical protein COB07_04955 [Sulfurovum sp.]|nr:MAG: hypothetical protein COB07_04955 [Sulfurovum sp.]